MDKRTLLKNQIISYVNVRALFQLIVSLTIGVSKPFILTFYELLAQTTCLVNWFYRTET